MKRGQKSESRKSGFCGPNDGIFLPLLSELVEQV